MREIRSYLSIPRPKVATLCGVVGGYIVRPVKPIIGELSWLIQELKNQHRISPETLVPFEAIHDDFIAQAPQKIPEKLKTFGTWHFSDESLISPPDDSVASIVVFSFLRNHLSAT